MDNSRIVSAVNSLLKENHVQWEKAYLGYADNLKKNKDNYSGDRSKFRMPKPMYAYSSISMASSSSSEFDIRVHGQSVGRIQVKNKDVLLNVSSEKAANTNKYFNLDYFVVDSKGWNSSNEAKRFRSMFKDGAFGRLKSEEHRIENLLLAEFSKRLRSDGKLLCNIQPVKLGNCFFQLTTPVKASTHGPSFSMSKNGGATGGGIDIMARIKHAATDTRLAIIELKDENNSKEPQKDVMLQALSYATFIAHLLRDKASGREWWNLFGFSGNVPEKLNIDVISLMPKGESEECCLAPIEIEDLRVMLSPYTLYYELDSKQIKGFSGTLMKEIMK